MWNIFKVNNKDTRTTPMAPFWYLYCSLWTHFITCPSVCTVNFQHVIHGCLNKVIHQITRNRTLASLQDIYGAVKSFWLNTETCLNTEISQNFHGRERDLFCKSILGIFWNSSGFNRSATFYMRTAAIQTATFTFTFDDIFYKATLFGKLENSYIVH